MREVNFCGADLQALTARYHDRWLVYRPTLWLSRRKLGKLASVYLKRHVRRKDGKAHVYYSLCESVRVSGNRVIQRRVLNSGKLNTTQLERWQRSIEVVQHEGERRQCRLFTDREGAAPPDAPEVCEAH